MADHAAARVDGAASVTSSVAKRAECRPGHRKPAPKCPTSPAQSSADRYHFKIHQQPQRCDDRWNPPLAR